MVDKGLNCTKQRVKWRNSLSWARIKDEKVKLPGPVWTTTQEPTVITETQIN